MTLVIGYGNPDRGDDAAGILAARKLKGVAYSGDALTLIDLWDGKPDVTVVDAMLSGAPAGTVHVWDGLAAPPRATGIFPSSHSFGLAEALDLARTLDRLPAKLTIVGIEGSNFTPGSEPCPEVLKAVDELAEGLLTGILTGGSGN